jgi:hypothetical protein
MRWLSRRTPQATPRGRHAAGATAAARLVVATEVVAAEVVTAPALISEVAAEPPPVPDRAGSGVHLGFADGSEHELTPGDPRVGAFRAVARTLVGA